jgi:hypothetical protein
MDLSLSPERRAALLIEKLTLDEKITMLHGVSPISSKGYVGYCIATTMAGREWYLQYDEKLNAGYRGMTQRTLRLYSHSALAFRTPPLDLAISRFLLPG